MFDILTKADNSPLTLNFTTRTVGEWRDFLKSSKRSNWLQTTHHAYAAYKRDQRVTKFATIEKVINSKITIIGMVAILELKLGPIHLVSLCRGPIWFKGHDTKNNFEEFALVFEKLYPKRLLRRIRWMPEWTFTDENISFVESLGFLKTKQRVETVWVDLVPSLEVIRKNLNRKWRNHLTNAEKSPLKITADNTGKYLNHFLSCYTLFKKQKNFKGPSAEFIRCEVEKALAFKDAIFLWAHLDGLPVAGILVFKHGSSASYRIGWNTSLGREHNSHFILLWKAIELLKKHGIESLDMGGILPGEAEGLTKFKMGLNGEVFGAPVLK